METGLQTAHGTWVCAELDGTVVGDRVAQGPWETWTVEPQDDGRVALKSAHGRYLCAEPDSSVIANREAVGPWELWAPEYQGAAIVALKSDHGRYLCVEPSGRVVADRVEVGVWECLGVTPWASVPPSAHVDPLVGVLRADYGQGTYDDSGRRLAIVCHAGDLLARYVYDAAAVRGHLDAIHAAGYHGVRTWTVLHGPYWQARTGEVNPAATADYWDYVRGFAGELRARGLRWLVSQGDLMRWAPRSSERAAFMRDLASALVACGGLDVILGVDAGNETWQNGEDDPSKLKAALDAFLSVLDVPIRSLTSPWAEEEANRFLVPGVHRDIHSSRGDWPAPARRVFNMGYEADPRVYTIQSEGPGPGPHVSAMAERDVFMEPETMGVLAACHALGRALFVYMSSPGVISDEPFTNYPAFALCPGVYAKLPRDVQGWRTFHGGEGRAFSVDRVLAVPSNDSLEVRCDHAAAGDQRVCVVYGPPGTYKLRVVNTFIGRILDPGTLEETDVKWSAGEIVSLTFNRGRVLIGRVQ